ncbi:MAG: Fe2+-dependent dioxygenase [Pseudomonadota bacterium]
MVVQLHQVLSKKLCQAILADLDRTPMKDGRKSAGSLGQNLKVNMQADSGSETYKAMVKRVMSALQAHEEFKKSAMPRRILPPLFSRYGPGSYYKRHIDNAFVGPFPAMRSDLSITIFLNDPEEYDGGMLSLETPVGTQEYRLAQGDAVLYPTYWPHAVTDITRGERKVVVTWVESLIREPQQREIISDLSNLMEWAVTQELEFEQLLRIEKTRLNLMRMWANT